MKLINLLIRELNNCSLGGDFGVSRHAQICQFDRFLQKLISKEHVVVIMEFPDWIQVKKIYYSILPPLGYFPQPPVSLNVWHPSLLSYAMNIQK